MSPKSLLANAFIPTGILLLVAAAPAVAADPQPALELSVTELNVASYDGAADIPVFFKGTDLPSGEAPLVAVDGGGQGPADLSVVFTGIADAFAKPEEGTRNPHFWKATAVVRNMPAGGEFQRTVLLQQGEATGLTVFTLKNTMPGSLSWELAAPPKELRLGPGREVTVAVKVGERRLEEFRLVQSTLQDPDSKFTLGLGSIELRGVGAGGSLPANTTTPVTVAIKKDFASPGAFDGNLSFGVQGDTNLKNVELLVYSRRNVWLGIGLIVLGLGLSWLAGVWLARRADRSAVLHALALARRRLPGFRETIAAVEAKGHKLHHVDDRADDLEHALDPANSKVKALMPPPAWAFKTTPWDRGPFDTHLQAQAKLAAALAEISRGFELVLEGWSGWTPNSRTAALTALDDLLAPAEVPDLATVRSGVDTAIELLQEATVQGQARTLIGLSTQPRPQRATLRQLEVQLATIGFVRWTLWAVLTVVIGYVVLILSEHGFGSQTDLVQCFFWGLGVQGASQGLDQLTRESSAGVLGLEVPD